MTSGFLVGVGSGRDRVQPIKPWFKLVGGWWGGGQALCRSVLLPQALAGYRFEGNLTVYGPLKTQSQVSILAKETTLPNLRQKNATRQQRQNPTRQTPRLPDFVGCSRELSFRRQQERTTETNYFISLSSLRQCFLGGDPAPFSISGDSPRTPQ